MGAETVSFIVPVYNVARYLPKCLESILAQDHDDIEVIVVNDGSPDECGKIIESYARKDPRIKYVNRQNSGVSAARNIGLSYASGNWIIFVDGDDWIDPDTASKALKAVKWTGAEVVMWGYKREFADKTLNKKIFDDGVKVFEGDELTRKIHRRFVGLYGDELAHPENADALVTVWGKMYRTDIIKSSGVRFMDTRIVASMEDGLFNIQLFGFVKKAAGLSDCLYHYRKDNEVSFTRKYNAGLYEGWQKLYTLIFQYIEGNGFGEDFYTALSNRVALGVIGLGLNETANPEGAGAAMKNLKKYLAAPRYRAAYKQLPLKYFPPHWKVFFIFCKMNFVPGLYVMLKIIQKLTGR